MLLVNTPEPVPSVDLLSPIVGNGDVDQHTPRTVMLPPPPSVIFPPETAVEEVTELAAVVVSVASPTGLVVNEISLPYAVPTLLVAYAFI
jgi:hypothetical protein